MRVLSLGIRARQGAPGPYQASADLHLDIVDITGLEPPFKIADEHKQSVRARFGEEHLALLPSFLAHCLGASRSPQDRANSFDHVFRLCRLLAGQKLVPNTNSRRARKGSWRFFLSR